MAAHFSFGSDLGDQDRPLRPDACKRISSKPAGDLSHQPSLTWAALLGTMLLETAGRGDSAKRDSDEPRI